MQLMKKLKPLPDPHSVVGCATKKHSAPCKTTHDRVAFERRSDSYLQDSVRWENFNDSTDKPCMLNFSAQTDALARVAELATQRHQVLAHNLANVNTQGYQRLDADFADEVRRQLLAGESLGNVQAQVAPTGEPTTRLDGNNVDVDREIGLLSQNALLHQTMTELLASRLGMLRRAAR